MTFIEEQWEEGLRRLHKGMEAGLWRVDRGPATATTIPWTTKRCRDCPFHKAGKCMVRDVTRALDADTCQYIEESNHAEAQEIIRLRQTKQFKGWWDSWGRLINGPAL